MSESNFSRGSWGWIIRRTQWSALGLSEEDFAKPKIAVVNTSSSLSICYGQLDEISKHVQDGIRAAGGFPFEIHTLAPSEALFACEGQGDSLATARTAIVQDIELMVRGSGLEGMVLLSSCDSTTPAHLRAAVRLDIPSIVVPCGYQTGTGGRSETNLYDVYEGFGAYLSGKSEFEKIDVLARNAVGSPGVCPGMATASTMHVICEGLGITLPGASPIAGGSAKLRRYAKSAGARAVELVRENLTARQVITRESFINSIMVAVAVGGATSAVTFLEEVAADIGLDLNTRQEMEKCDGRIPMLLQDIIPNGSLQIEEFEAAGGTLGVMKQLAERLDTDVKTVGGGKLRDHLDAATPPNEAVIRTLERPVGDLPGIVIMAGDVAPGGAFLRPFTSHNQKGLKGRARCLEGLDNAIHALQSNHIRSGDVLVMHGLSNEFASLLYGAGLHDVAVISDSSIIGMGRGPILISEVRPRFDEGGPISMIKDGDIIDIDIESRQIQRVT